MKILVVLGHPDPGSLNHALAATAVSALEQLGHKVLFHDLYAEGFEALLPAEEIPEDGPVDPKVLAHCEELAAADGIVIVHPNWWGMPPAILKGWIDRVVRPGVAYRFLEDDCGDDGAPPDDGDHVGSLRGISPYQTLRRPGAFRIGRRSARRAPWAAAARLPRCSSRSPSPPRSAAPSPTASRRRSRTR